jgi:hypothetical protein
MHTERLQQALAEAVETGEVSLNDANEFIDGFNTAAGPWLDYIPDEIEITMKGQFVIDFETTVTVPFLHSEEDVDEKIRVQFELLTDSVADSGAGMSISDMSITAAHRVDV